MEIGDILSITMAIVASLIVIGLVVLSVPIAETINNTFIYPFAFLILFYAIFGIIMIYFLVNFFKEL